MVPGEQGKFFANRAKKSGVTNSDYMAVLDLVENGDFRTLKDWITMFSKGTDDRSKVMYKFTDDLINAVVKFDKGKDSARTLRGMSREDVKTLYDGLLDDRDGGAKLTPEAIRLLQELEEFLK